MDLVTCRLDGPVAQVRLNRPEKLNALTVPLLAELGATARRLAADRSVRAVVLAGEGDSFSAGLDVATVLRDRAALARAFVPRPWRGTNTFQEACWAWRRVPVPVIAAVHGHCLGGGVQIALGADVRITHPRARWSVMEGRWGLVPDMSGAQALSELVGKERAQLLTMTAETFTGAQAVEYGLATTAADDPVAAAEELAGRLLERSPDALAGAKALFGRSWHRGPRRTFALERRVQLRLLRLPNTARARRAALRREAPEYLPRA